VGRDGITLSRWGSAVVYLNLRSPLLEDPAPAPVLPHFLSRRPLLSVAMIQLLFALLTGIMFIVLASSEYSIGKTMGPR
jgi:hypothetical protein